MVFDPDIITILKRNGEEIVGPEKDELLQPNRGQIQFQDGGALITLLENADLSTFLHESGHYFMFVLEETVFCAYLLTSVSFAGLNHQ